MKNDDKLKLALLPTLDALVSIGRSDYKIYSNLDHDNIEEIKDWLFKPNDRKGDLVVSKELLAGFKNETVLYLGFSDTSSSSTRWFSVGICKYKLGYKLHDQLKFEYSHWLKLQYLDWRENLIKDFLD